MPVVIKHKINAYIDRNRLATTDINKAKRYKSVSSAKAALSNMGYQNNKEIEFVEVEK